MAEIRIFDSAFLPGTKSASIGGDNLGIGPTHFTWKQDGSLTKPTFYTDSHVDWHPHKHKSVAWLLEPKSLRNDHIRAALGHEDSYHTILTYDARFLDRPKWKFYPYGGSWIAFDQWGMHEKTKNISIIASDKNTSEGHKLRHEIIRKFGDQIDVYGRGYNPIKSKFEALAPYRYSIIVESGRFDYYFTEKLIDCLSVGTIPIYWGCPSINKFFNLNGILDFERLCELKWIMPVASESTYDRFWEAIEDNLKCARKFAICEDWIWNNYPELFGRTT